MQSQRKQQQLLGILLSGPNVRKGNINISEQLDIMQLLARLPDDQLEAALEWLTERRIEEYLSDKFGER